MRRIHLIGRKNHGKTTLLVELVAQLAAQGLRVATIKHTHHAHELDTPGKDSHRHRLAGAQAVGVLAGDLGAIYWPRDAAGRADQGDAKYAPLEAMMSAMDVVLVEGDAATMAPKFEVWRAERGTPPLAVECEGVLAVVTDDPLPTALAARGTPTLARSELGSLVAAVLAAAGITPPDGGSSTIGR